jgi:hypothetical protein
MRRNRRLGGIGSVVLTGAAVLLLQAFGFSVANAQRKPPSDDTDRELFKLPAAPRVQEPASTRQQSSRTQSKTSRGLVGSPVSGSGNILTTDVLPSGTLVANAGPVSNCVLNGGGPTITCNLFETGGTGNPSEISNVVALPAPQTGGYLVLKDNAAAPDSDQTQWSDVLIFAPTAGAATTVQLFSAGCNTANPNDRSCFPSFATVTADPDRAFIVETKGSATVFNAGGSIYNIFSVDDNPPKRPFTLASSVGTVDEDSTAIVQLRNFTVTLLPAATGSVHIRYNITALDDISRFCPATQSVVRVRFRNSDNSGTTAQVAFDIHQTNVTSGGNNIIYSFNSNGRGAGTSFTTATDSPAIDFDFANNIYWIEATIFRSNTAQVADLGSIQIWEAGGTPCP